MSMSEIRSLIYVEFHFLQNSISLSICCVVVFSPLVHNGPAIKQVAEGNLPEGRSDRRERSFIACWALLNGA